tara:strand:- start:889 stop:3411 length:2523 start_codon:yes stop_codon:yes gene_type:complete
MSKLYDKNLIYIPSDLVGNEVIDQIRKRFGLETSVKPEKEVSLIFSNTDKMIFKARKDLDTVEKKVYEFNLNDFTGGEAATETFNKLKNSLAGDNENQAGAVFLAGLILAGEVQKDITDLIATPIIDKDLFFDSSFTGGQFVDRSVLLPSDATEEEIEQAKLPIAGVIDYYFYAIKSFFVKYVNNDPFSRFEGDTDASKENSTLTPTFYQLVRSGFFDTEGTPNNLFSQMSYASLENEKESYIAFYDLETYNTFLQGCQEIAEGKLRSVAKYIEQPSLWTPAQKEKKVFENLTSFQDVVPFYTKTKFTTDNNDTFNGFSFSRFLTSPQIEPFFKQLISLYVDTVRNPSVYADKLWFDAKEEISVFDAANGQLETKFDSRVIRATELVKDEDFLNSSLSKNGENGACSNIKKKLSALLFSKKIKEFSKGTLTDDETFFTSPNYSETICYRITKTDNFTKKVNHWFVPNFPSLNIVQIFDNNIRFNSSDDVKYEIFALKATVAVDYLYKAPPGVVAKNVEELLGNENFYASITDGNGSVNLKFTVEAIPSVNFIEVPYFSKDDVIIYDSAPARPNLGLYAYKGVDNKITALFTGYVDQYRAKRESILQDETTINDNAAKYARQHYSFAKEELYYKTESEDIDVFELFVLETAPMSLKDFRKAKRIEIKNTFDPLLIQELDAANKPHGSSFTLDLLPNKDYWLLGRVKDFNGNISNASTVKKVNIINDDGYINPTIQVYNMDVVRLPKEVDTSPDFKKLIYISPALGHTIVQPLSDGKIDVGVGATQPYKKKYKIRIKSKKTNKKIDLNIFFDKVVYTIKDTIELPKGFSYDVNTLDLEPDEG